MEVNNAYCARGQGSGIVEGLRVQMLDGNNARETLSVNATIQGSLLRTSYWKHLHIKLHHAATVDRATEGP